MNAVLEQTKYESKIDIDKNVKKQLIDVLNQQMADNFDLYSQTKQAHWNVKGSNFMQLHVFFDDLAASIEGFTDSLAERITALGGVAKGTLRMAASQTSLTELSEISSGKAYLEALAQRYASYAKSTRAAIKKASELEEPTSEDLFTEISRTVDKDLYFIESHLQG